MLNLLFDEINCFTCPILSTIIVILSKKSLSKGRIALIRLGLSRSVFTRYSLSWKPSSVSLACSSRWWVCDWFIHQIIWITCYCLLLIWTLFPRVIVFFKYWSRGHDGPSFFIFVASHHSGCRPYICAVSGVFLPWILLKMRRSLISLG